MEAHLLRKAWFAAHLLFLVCFGGATFSSRVTRIVFFYRAALGCLCVAHGVILCKTLFKARIAAVRSASDDSAAYFSVCIVMLLFCRPPHAHVFVLRPFAIFSLYHVLHTLQAACVLPTALHRFYAFAVAHEEAAEICATRLEAASSVALLINCVVGRVSLAEAAVYALLVRHLFATTKRMKRAFADAKRLGNRIAADPRCPQFVADAWYRMAACIASLAPKSASQGAYRHAAHSQNNQ